MSEDRKVEIQHGYDPRTEIFYDYLKSKGQTNEQIATIRERLRKLSPEDNLSNYFIHEAKNAFGPFLINKKENLITWTSGDYQRSRETLLGALKGFDWFKKEGVLSKKQIKSYLDEAEQVGEWNQDVVEKLYEKFIDLIKTASSRSFSS